LDTPYRKYKSTSYRKKRWFFRILSEFGQEIIANFFLRVTFWKYF
jgi:hypothetical protein